MSKQLTPIQELIEWMDNQPQAFGEVYDKATELLEKEKKIIEDAFNAGEKLGWEVYREDETSKEITAPDFETYYQETFKQ